MADRQQLRVVDPAFDAGDVRGPIFLVSGLDAVPNQDRRVWLGTSGAAVFHDPDLGEDCLYVSHDVETVAHIARTWTAGVAAGDRWLALGHGHADFGVGMAWIGMGPV